MRFRLSHPATPDAQHPAPGNRNARGPTAMEEGNPQGQRYQRIQVDSAKTSRRRNLGGDFFRDRGPIRSKLIFPYSAAIARSPLCIPGMPATLPP